jgi:energy-coupling factor transport system substrate-specific component
MSSSLGSQPTTTARGRTTVLASRPLVGYRTVDLVTAAMLGVAFGVVFWAWTSFYYATSPVFEAAFAPLTGLYGGTWLLAGVVAGLLVRRPGAALMAEMIAASVSALLGSSWGWTVLLSGFLQGLAVEIVLAVFLWKRFGPSVAMLAGALAATFETVFFEWWVWFADFTWSWKLFYLAAFVVSGAVIAGLGGLAIVRGLARLGAVPAMPAGQEELERSAR